MKETEYRRKLAILNKEYNAKVESLKLQYALDAARAKVGDKISDGKRQMMVEDVRLYPYSLFPQIQYIGKIRKTKAYILNEEVTEVLHI